MHSVFVRAPWSPFIRQLRPSASSVNPSSVNPLFDSSLNRPEHQSLINVGTKTSPNFLRVDGNHSSTGSGTRAKKNDLAPSEKEQNREKGDLTGKSQSTKEAHGKTAKKNYSAPTAKQQNRGKRDSTGKSRSTEEEARGTTAKKNHSAPMEKHQNRGRGDSTGKSRSLEEVPCARHLTQK